MRNNRALNTIENILAAVERSVNIRRDVLGVVANKLDDTVAGFYDKPEYLKLAEEFRFTFI